MRVSLGWLLSLSLLLVPLGATAQQSQSWYTVEALIFERTLATDAAGEQWPTLETLPALDDATPLLPAFGSDEVLARVPFRRLAESDHRLGSIADALRNDSRYNLLQHVAWRQPGLDPQQAVAVRLQPRGRESILAATLLREDTDAIPPEPSVEGVLKLITSRFLHIEADLVYLRPATSGDEELGQTLAAFRLNESRRMRNREVHYFDHPLFGLIVSVQPYTRPSQ